MHISFALSPVSNFIYFSDCFLGCINVEFLSTFLLMCLHTLFPQYEQFRNVQSESTVTKMKCKVDNIINKVCFQEEGEIR